MTSGLLQGKVVIVTGGSSGIGKAIAMRFAGEKARTVVSSRDVARCEHVALEIRALGQESLAVACDVRDEVQVASLFDHTQEVFGDVDVVVANAGISGGNKTIEDYSLEEWNRVLATNLTGVFLTIREAFRRMKPRGGNVIVIGSQAGVEAYAKKGAYCASKFGARGVAHALGEEGRRFGINVSVINPGTVDTPILVATNTKVKSPMSASAVADAALYLSRLQGNSLVRDITIERMLLD